MDVKFLVRRESEENAKLNGIGEETKMSGRVNVVFLSTVALSAMFQDWFGWVAKCICASVLIRTKLMCF
jgi:hypothetical protein